MGPAKRVGRRDPFAIAYAVANSETNRLYAKFQSRAWKAYLNAFGGQNSAPITVIGSALNSTSIPLMKRGNRTESALYSSNAAVEATIEKWQACWDDMLAAFQTESFSDNPADNSTASDEAATSAWSTETAACNSSMVSWTALSQEDAAP